MACRICLAPTRVVLDLGMSPPANSLKTSPDQREEKYPLVLEWCETCDNVQLRDTLSAEDLYRDYLYVTPDSRLLESHYDVLLSYLTARGYVTPQTFVVEAGSLWAAGTPAPGARSNPLGDAGRARGGTA